MQLNLGSAPTPSSPRQVINRRSPVVLISDSGELWRLLGKRLCSLNGNLYIFAVVYVSKIHSAIQARVRLMTVTRDVGFESTNQRTVVILRFIVNLENIRCRHFS